MNDKFGQFDWKCWKDEKPTVQAWIYLYYADIPDADIEIAQEHDISFDEHTYWCYVFVPDAPKIEKKDYYREIVIFTEKLEDRIDRLEAIINNRYSNDYILELESRFSTLEKQVAVLERHFEMKRAFT